MGNVPLLKKLLEMNVLPVPEIIKLPMELKMIAYAKMGMHLTQVEMTHMVANSNPTITKKFADNRTDLQCKADKVGSDCSITCTWANTNPATADGTVAIGKSECGTCKENYAGNACELDCTADKH